MHDIFTKEFLAEFKILPQKVYYSKKHGKKIYSVEFHNPHATKKEKSLMEESHRILKTKVKKQTGKRTGQSVKRLHEEEIKKHLQSLRSVAKKYGRESLLVKAPQGDSLVRRKLGLGVLVAVPSNLGTRKTRGVSRLHDKKTRSKKVRHIKSSSKHNHKV